MCRGFAYVNLVSTDAKLGKCMNVLNGCAWRGGKLQISQAKPNRFRTLENGSIAIINEGDGKKQKKKPKKKRKLVRMAGDQSLVTDKNVDKRKGWRRGRYGRAIACLRIRKPNRQLLVIDPSHYKNNLEKLFGSVKPKPLSQLLWTITDIKESEIEDIKMEMDSVEASEAFESESVQSESYNIDEIVDIEMEDVQDLGVPVEGLAVESELIEPVPLQEPIEEVEVCIQQEPEAELSLKALSEASPEAESSPEASSDVKSSASPKSLTVPVPESKFEVNVNWSSLFTPSTNDSAPLFGSSISNKLKNSVPVEELFKKPVPEIEKEKEREIINNINELTESAEAALALANKKQATHNYASLFGDLNRITPTTATRFGMLLSQKEDMLHEWRIERIELKEDFKKRLSEGKRRNRRNKVNN